MRGLVIKGFQTMSLIPEWILVKQAKFGDRDAFGKLYQKYLDKIYRYVYFRVGQNNAMAEDVVSNVFLKAWENIKNFGGGSFQAWVYTIARNTIIDHYRTQRPTIELTETIIDDAQLPEEQIGKRMQFEKIRKAFSFLTAEQQEVVTMRFINDMSHREIAVVLGKKEDAIRALQYRALKELKKYVSE